MEFSSIPKSFKEKNKASLHRLSQTQNCQHVFILFSVYSKVVLSIGKRGTQLMSIWVFTFPYCWEIAFIQSDRKVTVTQQKLDIHFNFGWEMKYQDIYFTTTGPRLILNMSSLTGFCTSTRPIPFSIHSQWMGTVLSEKIPPTVFSNSWSEHLKSIQERNNLSSWQIRE